MNTKTAEKPTAADALTPLRKYFSAAEAVIREGGGPRGIERQHRHGRLTARERIDLLVDRLNNAATQESANANFQEIGLWSAFEMYEEAGGVPAAGVVVGLGRVHGRLTVIVANDATVKAGAFFPATCKKVLRAQRFSHENKLPILYLVDSAGVFLPMQDEIFPDEDDFGRIFRNNAIMSADGVPQFAAIMGNCVAGGGYLPVMCDTLLMTEGSGLYLAGPALVKAAIGQEVSSEELGGAEMHAAISGTIDYREPNDELCLERLRRLVGQLGHRPHTPFSRVEAKQPKKKPTDIPSLVFESIVSVPSIRTSSPVASVPPSRTSSPVASGVPAGRDGAQNATAQADGNSAGTATPPPDPKAKMYDVRDLLNHILDADSFDEYKAEYGQSIVCGFGRLDGWSVGIVANQRKTVKPARGPMQFPGVIYTDSADKMARFILDCNQMKVPLIFLQDVSGFMVGRDSEQAGIIRSGAKVVNAVSNSVVPKITLITGGSYGAGNYALCGKAYDPRFIFAWPTAKYAVMSGASAAKTLLGVEIAALKRQGHEPDAAEMAELEARITATYEKQMDIRYAAARGWVDAIIMPEDTRRVLALALEAVAYIGDLPALKTGVFQV